MLDNFIITDPQYISLSGVIPLNFSGKRIDQVLATMFPEYSRENLKQWLLDGSCLINDHTTLPKRKVKGGELIMIRAKNNIKIPSWAPENLPLEVVFEDRDILILNKSSNLVMHPGAGNWSGTLLNALLGYLPELKFLPRAGIVHRLDKDTTGLVIIAKNLLSYNNLCLQLKNRTIVKIYEAIVIGQLIAGGSLDAPIGRNPNNRLKMSVIANGKAAITHYRVLKKFKNYTYIKLEIETGRTHQIRVHMKHIRHPVLGDRLYAKSSMSNHQMNMFPRQALHAKELHFKHPTNKQDLHFITDLPPDMCNLLKLLDTNLCNNTDNDAINKNP